MELRLEIDDELVNDATLIYETLGIDTETAVRMFLKRTVLERRLPLNTSLPTTGVTESLPSSKRTNNVITRPMAEDIWRRFIRYANEGGDINAIAAEAHSTTGMNQGSAFIYLTILDNLINGKHNTRNMKMADLRYYVEQIRDELDVQSYSNAIKSLKASIPYWDKEAFGMFASKVQAFVDELEEQ